MTTLARTLAGIALAAAAAGAAAADEPIRCREFPVPYGAQLVIVAPDMALNGVPMTIKELRTKDAPDALLAFYRREWATNKMGTFETPVQDWRTIATLDGPCYYTVQVRPEGAGSYALLGVSRRPTQVPREPGAGFPMPYGSKVYNDLAHHDGPKNARTVLLINQRSPAHNVAFYRDTFTRQGWLAMIDRSVSTDKGPTHVMLWRRGVEEASITVHRSGDHTTVVANIVDKP